MISNGLNKASRALPIIFSILLIGLVTYRSYSVSITFDEVASIRDSFANIYDAAKDSANSQYLNSVLTKWSSLIFGDHLFAFRLPNVFAYLLFLWGSFSISKNLLGKKYFLGVIVLNGSFFLLDFFSISRGYGLSLGFCLAGLALLTDKKENIFTQSLLSSLLFTLGALSNLTALNTLLVVLPFVLGKIIFSNENLKRKLLASLGVGIQINLFVLFIQPIISSLIEGNQLYFGGREGVIKDTIFSTGNVLAYHAGFNSFFVILAYVIFGLAFIISLINVLLSGFDLKKQTSLVFEWAFILSLISIELQHLIFETNFPVERTALFLFALTLLVIIKGPAKGSIIYRKWLLAPTAILFLVQFVRTVNTDITYSWKFTAGSKDVIEYLSQLPIEDQKSITVGMDILVDPPTKFCLERNEKANFKLETLNEFWVTKINLEELNIKYYGFDYSYIPEGKLEEMYKKIKDGRFDYIYLLHQETNEVLRRNYNYEVVFHHEAANTYLLKYVAEK